MAILQESTATKTSFFPSLTIRTRTGLIFFMGLFLLIAATLVITDRMSRVVEQHEAVIALLKQLSEPLDLWAGDIPAVPTSVALPLLTPNFEQTIALLLNGGQLPRSEDTPLLLPPANNPDFVLALEQARSAWHNLQSTTRSLTGQTETEATRRHLADLGRQVQAALAQARQIIEADNMANVGAVRGMYAALFLSTLIFLLVGLWFTEQTVVAPVEALSQIANQIASGDLETPVRLSGQGEFLTLTHSFEAMRRRLKESHEQLLRWADSLQVRVAQRTQQISALSQVVATASRSLELDEVLRTSLAQSLQVIDVEIGGLWLIDPASGELHLAAAYGMPDLMQAQLSRLKVGEGFTGGAAQTGQMIVLDDISHMSPEGVRGIAIREGVRSLAIVPIKIRERVLGVLDVMSHRRREFAPEEVALLTSIGQQIGIAVDNLRLLQETRHQAQQVAALQERERIGAELHDGLLQTLGYVYLTIDLLNNQARANGLTEMTRELSNLDQVLERTSREVRQYVADLRQTGPLPPSPLHSALHEMVTKFKHESEIQVSLETEGAPLWLDNDRNAQLVRIAREALLNASRHGQALHAFIICSNQGRHGQLCIQDDGLGFVPGQLPADGRNHFGLSIMQARAERIGGQLTIDSRPGQGASVCVTWPLETR